MNCGQGCSVFIAVVFPCTKSLEQGGGGALNSYFGTFRATSDFLVTSRKGLRCFRFTCSTCHYTILNLLRVLPTSVSHPPSFIRAHCTGTNRRGGEIVACSQGAAPEKAVAQCSWTRNKAKWVSARTSKLWQHHCPNSKISNIDGKISVLGGKDLMFLPKASTTQGHSSPSCSG